MKLVDPDRTLTALYNDMLKEWRRLDLADARGESVCVRCGLFQKDHLLHGECDGGAFSRGFKKDDERQVKAERALVLLEELMGL